MPRLGVLAGFVLVVVALLNARPELHDDDWIRRRVQTIRTSDTDRWRRIPWAGSLAEAAAQARRENLPLFVFSHEGNIDTGRC